MIAWKGGIILVDSFASVVFGLYLKLEYLCMIHGLQQMIETCLAEPLSQLRSQSHYDFHGLITKLILPKVEHFSQWYIDVAIYSNSWIGKTFDASINNRDLNSCGSKQI